MMQPGKHDVYRELVPQVLTRQKHTGAFESDSGKDAVIETSFALLFLARGREVLAERTFQLGNIPPAQAVPAPIEPPAAEEAA